MESRSKKGRRAGWDGVGGSGINPESAALPPPVFSYLPTQTVEMCADIQHSQSQPSFSWQPPHLQVSPPPPPRDEFVLPSTPLRKASHASSCGSREQHLIGQLSEWSELLITSEAACRQQFFFYDLNPIRGRSGDGGEHEPHVLALLHSGANLHFHISHSGRRLIKNSSYGNTRRASEALRAGDRCSQVQTLNQSDGLSTNYLPGKKRKPRRLPAPFCCGWCVRVLLVCVCACVGRWHLRQTLRVKVVNIDISAKCADSGSNTEAPRRGHFTFYVRCKRQSASTGRDTMSVDCLQVVFIVFESPIHWNDHNC